MCGGVLWRGLPRVHLGVVLGQVSAHVGLAGRAADVLPPELEARLKLGIVSRGGVGGESAEKILFLQ